MEPGHYFLLVREPLFDLGRVSAVTAARVWLSASSHHDGAYDNQEFLAEVRCSSTRCKPLAGNMPSHVRVT